MQFQYLVLSLNCGWRVGEIKLSHNAFDDDDCLWCSQQTLCESAIFFSRRSCHAYFVCGHPQFTLCVHSTQPKFLIVCNSLIVCGCIFLLFLLQIIRASPCFFPFIQSGYAHRLIIDSASYEFVFTGYKITIVECRSVAPFTFLYIAIRIGNRFACIFILFTCRFTADAQKSAFHVHAWTSEGCFFCSSHRKVNLDNWHGTIYDGSIDDRV